MITIKNVNTGGGTVSRVVIVEHQGREQSFPMLRHDYIKFVALDADGDLFGYTERPHLSDTCEMWSGEGFGTTEYIGTMADDGEFCYIPDWRETLFEVE